MGRNCYYHRQPSAMPSRAPFPGHGKPCRSRHWLLDGGCRASLPDPRAPKQGATAQSGGIGNVLMRGRQSGRPARTEQVDAIHEKPLAVTPAAAVTGAEGLGGRPFRYRSCASDFAAHSPARRHEANRPDADAPGLHAQPRLPHDRPRRARARRRPFAYSRRPAGPRSCGVRAAARLENS